VTAVPITAAPETLGGTGAPARRSRLRAVADSRTMLLSVGTLASGVLAYLFNVVVARALGPADYGPIAVLWAGMFLVSVVLFRPIEQTLTRALSERAAREEDARPVIRSMGRVTLAAMLASTVAIALAWKPLSDRLFAGHDVLTLALALGIAGYGVSYFVRGAAAGLLWLDGYGLLLLADGAVRVLLVVPLVFVASPAVAGAAVAAAAIGGGLAPSVHRKWRDRQRREAELLGPLRGSRPAGGGAAVAVAMPFKIGHALRFAAPATVIAGADQVLVSGGALLVVLQGGPGAAAAAGTVFAATMLVRAPVFLFQGLAASLLPNLTRLDTLGDERGFRRHLGMVSAALLGFGGVLTLGALVAGPQVMGLLFGDGFVVERADLAMLCSGVGVYLLGATLSQAALARGYTVRAALVWTASATGFIGVQLAMSGTPLHRVSMAFALAAVVLAGLLAPLVVRGRPAPQHDVISSARAS
jgi:O-antigen/teichoic acid export membrane protein